MASIDRGIELSGWSDDLRDMIRRRISESGGVALITLSALIAVALATWSVQDPSLSHAIDGPVRNFLGTPGAIGGDIGDAMLRLPELMLGSLGGLQLMIVAAIFGTCTLAAVVIATGFGYHDPSDVKLDERWAKEAAGPEDNEEERTSISLGWLVHGLLSMKARIIRLVTRRSALHAPKPIRRAPTPAVSERD